MILATDDVHYTDPTATSAGVCFTEWTDAQPTHEFTSHIPQIAPYEPGSFYKRELPCPPLFVTCVGIELTDAKRAVQVMHGPFRLPTLLKRVDQLCRDIV